MSLSYLRYLYLAYLSKPVCDRALYRAVRRVRARRILEVGIGSADRTVRLVALAKCLAGGDTVRYTAIDPFEARETTSAEAISLKGVYRKLSPSGAKVQLIPGNPAEALPRAANSLMKTDLIIVSAEHDVRSVGAAWFYVPRMLHSNTRVYLETRSAEKGESSFRLMPAAEIDLLASGCRRRRAA